MELYNNYIFSVASEKEVIDRMKLCDANKDGHVDLPEYTKFMNQAMGWCEIAKNVNAKTFTDNGCFENDKINQDQFEKCIEKFGGEFV
jgi:hypothetical protein